jgi:hypothetical protein
LAATENITFITKCWSKHILVLCAESSLIKAQTINWSTVELSGEELRKGISQDRQEQRERYKVDKEKFK